MAFLFTIAIALVAAENVVELEPVQDLYTQNCGIYNGSGKADCQATPYCWYNSSTDKCHNDPCYRWIGDDASGTDCGSGNGGGVTGLPCSVREYVTYTPDCSTPTTTKTKKFCSGQDGILGAMTPCTYEYLKSNKTTCPAYLCEPGTHATGFETCDDVSSGGCPSNLICACLTETYCSLNPYCYVANHTCIEDLCTDFTDDVGQGCVSRKDVHPAVSGKYNAISDDCMVFKVFDGSSGHANGATVDLCVNSQRNKAPNKCYELWNGYTTSGTGACIAYSLPKCAENAECVAESNTSGPYAAYYCGDAQHSSSSVMIHAPAMIMIVFAVLAFLLK